MAPSKDKQPIASILSSLKKELPKDDQPLFGVFVRALFERTEPEDLKDFQDASSIKLLLICLLR